MRQSRRQRQRARRRSRKPEPMPYGQRRCGGCTHWRGQTIGPKDGHYDYGQARICFGPGLLCNTVRNAVDPPCPWHRTERERPHVGPNQVNPRNVRNFPRDCPERAQWAG